MKQLKWLLPAVVLLGMPTFVRACDVCGCSGGGASMGFLPLVQRHFVGVRWQSFGFETLPHGSVRPSSETFQTLDLWGRWQPHRRVQIFGILPYAWSGRNYVNGPFLSSRGFGDVSLLVQFSLLDPARQSARKWQHSLQVGGGAQLPSGRTGLTDAEGERLHANLQPGAGAPAFLVSGLYAVRRGVWGLSLDGNARLAGENAAGYRFGTRMNGALRCFRATNMGRIVCLPHAGLTIDARDEDRDGGKWQDETGGYALFGAFGADIFSGNFSFGIGCQIPASHRIADGIITPKPRLNASATFLFGGKSKKGELPEAAPAIK